MYDQKLSLHLLDNTPSNNQDVQAPSMNCLKKAGFDKYSHDKDVFIR